MESRHHLQDSEVLNMILLHKDGLWLVFSSVKFLRRPSKETGVRYQIYTLLKPVWGRYDSCLWMPYLRKSKQHFLRTLWSWCVLFWTCVRLFQNLPTFLQPGLCARFFRLSCDILEVPYLGKKFKYYFQHLIRVSVYLICLSDRNWWLLLLLPANHNAWKHTLSFSVVQGGSNMTGTNCDLFTHK